MLYRSHDGCAVAVYWPVCLLVENGIRTAVGSAVRAAGVPKKGLIRLIRFFPEFFPKFSEVKTQVLGFS